MRQVKRKKMDDRSDHSIWRSYSDMMSGLLLLFVLIMAVCLMQAQKNYTEKLAEQAKALQTQSALEESQSTVEQQASALSEKESELEASLSKLDLQEKTLAEQASALEELQAALEAQRITLNEKESELDASQSALDEKEALLQNSQEKLDEANELMQTQQQRIDQIIGVKAELIADLNEQFSANAINVEIDTETGAILLDSSVLFAYNESELTSEGLDILDQILPIYCQVLLGGEYADYVAEIIIDGYTDSSGDYLTNLDLSQERAYAVASYLYENRQRFLTEDESETLLSRLTANGKSNSNLILNEDGTENADASRRVEVKFRLRDEEMLDELQAIIGESRVTEETE